MYRIAHNHLVDHYRRQKPEGQLETAELTDNRPLPPQQLMADQQSNEMYNRISELPEEQRNTLLLKLEAGLKMEEIATVTGVSRETVKSRLRYAVSKLKRSLVE
jgi:RNA polymerase sigma-70 factor (ECF subfamily)